jgi:hypothetical protein
LSRRHSSRLGTIHPLIEGFQTIGAGLWRDIGSWQGFVVPDGGAENSTEASRFHPTHPSQLIWPFIGQSCQNPPPTIMSAINKSRQQPQPVSFIGNPLLPLLYAQRHYSQRNTMAYMELVGLIAN